MKKLMMTAAVVACAAAVTAQTVTSANIVGYAKATVPGPGFEIVAPQFNAGDAGGITLGDAFSGMNDLDEVLFWNGAGYDTFRYYAGYGWYYNNDIDPADDVLVPEGQAIWAKSAVGATLIMAGEVPTAASVTNSVAVGFNMIANPYPVEIALGDLDVSQLTDVDEILVWNGTGYDIYRYYAGYGWYFNNDIDPADTVKIGVGQGVWLKAAAAGEMVFDKQY
jgi:hypothetical protein